MDETARNRELMGRFYSEVFVAGNLDLIDELVAPDFIEHEQLPPGVPAGPEGLKIFVQTFRDAFPDMVLTPTVTLAEGDLVAAHVEMKATHTGAFGDVPPSGNTVSWGFIDIVRLRDGKAVEHWGGSDMLSLMQQIGAGGEG